MVAARANGALEAAKNTLSVVVDLGVLAVNGLAADRSPPEGLHHRLVAQANPERRYPGLGKRARGLGRDSRLGRGAWPGRDHEPVGLAFQELSHARLVVSDHVRLGAQFPQVLDEVVSERVVVVDDDNLHGQSPWFAASSTAANTAFALLMLSANS